MMKWRDDDDGDYGDDHSEDGDDDNDANGGDDDFEGGDDVNDDDGDEGNSDNDSEGGGMMMPMKMIMGIMMMIMMEVVMMKTIMMETRALAFTSDGGTKSWCESATSMNIQRKSLLDGCDDWAFSADFPKWNKHSKVIQDIGLKCDIIFHSSATRHIIIVELTVPYKSRMEEANTYKTEKYKDLSKELEKAEYNPRYCL
ncbi:reverse transcriptase [Plakobranchus ocellatus]|uniref:Reverse transcriptase n=1 Tax=Plakobranchus ocellatus TaxID=259542 RepID=A0AAV4BFL8_9GAST|nr:reverse transcriptase [Plakobranchus ocellatus]